MTDPIDTARDIDCANRLIGLIVVALTAGSLASSSELGYERLPSPDVISAPGKRRLLR